LYNYLNLMGKISDMEIFLLVLKTKEFDIKFKIFAISLKY